MSLVFRAGTQAAVVAFVLSVLTVLAFYVFIVGEWPRHALVTALGLGLVPSAAVLAAVCVVVHGRLARKRPVLGAWRGAAIAVMALAVLAVAHTGLTYGSGGFAYSLLGQVGFACLIGGGPAAIAGALLGRWIEARLS